MYFQAPLYTCILSMLFLIDGIPTHPINFKTLVGIQAETIIQRINLHKEKLNLSPDLIIGNSEHYLLVPADETIQGLAPIVDTLTNFQKNLQKLPNGHVDQIHEDVFNLLAYLNETMTTMHCTPKETDNGKFLETLFEVYADHHITFGLITLGGLKEFMQKLIVNLDQLESC